MNVSAPPAALDQTDPKGLIRESYAMDPISDAECRSILIDWALSLPAGADMQAAIAHLLAKYTAAGAGHPMTKLLQNARSPAAQPMRRGGRAARMGG